MKKPATIVQANWASVIETVSPRSRIMLLIEGHRSHLRDFAFSPDGLRLASAAGRGARVSLWDAGTGERIRYLNSTNYDPITSLLWLPHDGTLIAGTVWGTIRHWPDENVKAGIFPRRHDAWTTKPVKLLTTPDGKWFVVGCNNYYGAGYRVHRWALEGPPEATQRTGSTGTGLKALSISPDGEKIAMSGTNYSFRVQFCDKRTRYVDVNGVNVRSVAFSPDGTLLAVASLREVQIWKVHGLEVEQIAVLTGHQGTVNDLAFTPDGSRVLSGSDDETVRVWDVDGLCERATFSWDIGEIKTVRVAQDGMRAGAGGYRKIMVWDIED